MEELARLTKVIMNYVCFLTTQTLSEWAGKMQTLETLAKQHVCCVYVCLSVLCVCVSVSFCVCLMSQEAMSASKVEKALKSAE